MKTALLIFLLISSCFSETKAQCSVTSTTGYTVTISLTTTTVNAPTSCPNGYSYTVNIQYNIVFSGNNIPSSLYTLQGNLVCGSTSSFFNLPNGGGSGTTSTSNAYTNMTNCATSTPASLNCNTANLSIQGPGINYTTISCKLGSPLPIELVEFSGHLVENSKVKLNWSTATENNNDYFLVERSKDGQVWEKVTTVLGAGNSETIIHYAYIDESPLRESISYYRLIQTDFNGDYDYSPIISIHRTGTISNSIFIFPNPTKNLLTLEGESETLQEIEIYSIDGKRIYDFQKQNLNNNSVTLEVGNLNVGIYLVKTKQGMHRFVKQ